jgi:hypothetical protein
MQKLRFRRYSELFKIALTEAMPELDIFNVFFYNGLAKLLSPALRRDIIVYCVAGSTDSPLVNYLVILEANDNPYAVTDRFDKDTIDRAFDVSRTRVLTAPLQDLTDPIWGRIALHLGHYFKAIN